MDIGLVAVLAVVGAAVLVAVIVAWAVIRRRRTEEFTRRFGPEYERLVESYGSRREAEQELERRQRRREQLAIRPLSAEAHDRFTALWAQAERTFVDAPAAALGQAHGLITDLMRERGYPVEDFEQRAADLSVDHPEIVQEYRRGQVIVAEHERGDADTEDMRRAMTHYRSLFERLLEAR